MSKKKLEIGDRVRHLVESNFKTVDEFAHKMKISRSSVYNWFKNEDMKATRVIEIAEKLGVSAHWLMTGEHPTDFKLSDSEASYQLLSNNKAGGYQNFFSNKAFVASYVCNFVFKSKQR